MMVVSASTARASASSPILPPGMCFGDIRKIDEHSNHPPPSASPDNSAFVAYPGQAKAAEIARPPRLVPLKLLP